ncbi:MAG: gluconate 2-dehydrogenase subunit 3 family protein [Xanthobacteraceae bacterium]
MSADHPITRRQAILSGSAAVAAAALPDGALAQVKKVAQPALPAGKFLSARDLAILDEVAELIIPADAQSGGAKAAKCALFIDARLAESIDPVWRQSWKEDLREIDEVSAQMFGRGFLETSPAERIKLMDRMSRNENKKPLEDINYAFGTIKWWVAEAYYTSQLGIHDELEYQGNIYIDEFAGDDVTPIDRT